MSAALPSNRAALARLCRPGPVDFSIWAFRKPFLSGPRWLLLVVILALLVPMTIAHRLNHIPVLRMLIFNRQWNSITAAMIAAIAFLIQGPSRASRNPQEFSCAPLVGLWLTKHSRFCPVVLEIGCRRASTNANAPGEILRSAFLFPQNDAAGKFPR